MTIQPLKRRRPKRIRQLTNAQWPEAQDMLIRECPELSDALLAKALSNVGPTRTAAAVTMRRISLGVRRDGMTIQEYRAHEAARRSGWPVMIGTFEERDDLYVETLLKAMKKAGVTPWAAFQCIADRNRKQTPSLEKTAP